MVSIVDVRHAVRQIPSSNDGQVADLSVDGLLVVTIAGFNTA